ncbi:MAG: glycine betaine ABC transporter substrate-binding protein [Gordonia sp. (in: high G+C Gram-positive bacteria)]|uniref:glycine betaine ABC transporter substrate-binding protein n=1 Tax=Gordonia sp. (in: high G+C Gram-positive bacteria) TaxID=84139 RepID=UPI003BB55689
MRQPTRALAVLFALLTAVAVVTACGDEPAPPLLIGSADRADLRAAAAVYAVALTRAGIPATTEGGLVGPDSELVAATAAGELELFPAYTGQLLSQLTAEPAAYGAEELQIEVSRSLPQGVAIGDPTGVSDRPQLLMAAQVRERFGVDAVSLCGRLPAGMPLVTVDGPPAAIVEAFASCHSGAVQRVSSPREVVDRVADGQALGVLSALQIAALGDLGDVRTVPSDGPPRAQDLVPVYRSAALDRAALKQLSRVAGELTTADLARLAARVERGEDPSAVAADWLAGAVA